MQTLLFLGFCLGALILAFKAPWYGQTEPTPAPAPAPRPTLAAWEEAARSRTVGEHVITWIGRLITWTVILALCGGAIVIALGVLSWSWRQL